MNYISTLIVDDDKILLDSLIHTLKWEDYGFEIVATASNGVQALKYYHQFHPQLIITDIVMPVMNGIDLLKEIRALDNDTYILMLSSYDDFNYAKESINYKANNYVLKDEINCENLKEWLVQIRTRLESNLKHSKLLEYKIISDFFEDKNHQVAPTDMNSSTPFMFEKKFCYILVEVSTPIFLFDNKSYKPHDVSAEISNIDYENITTYLIVPISNRHVLLLIRPISDNSLTQKQNIMKNFSAHLCHTLEQHFSSRFACLYYLSPITISEFRNVFYQYHLNHRFFTHNDGLKIIEDITALQTNSMVPDQKEILNTISNSLTCNDLSKVQSILEAVFKEYTNVYATWGVETIIQQLFDLLDDMYFSHKKQHLNPPELYTYKEFIVWFTQTCDRIILTNSEKDVSYSLPIKLTIENINRDYANQELNIATLADKVFLSTGYLSTLFKNETGKSINEFITNVRIQNAKQLLANPALKIYHISTMTGYSSAQYFAQIFYKTTGMTPKQYRRHLQNEQN